MFPQSLRWRIQIWHGLVLVAVLAGFGAAAYRYQWASEMRRVDGELRGRVAMLVNALPAPRERPLPGARRPADFEFRLPPDRASAFATGGYYYIVWKRDGAEWARSADAPQDVAMPAQPNGNAVVPLDRTSGLFRESFAFTPPGECLLAGRSIEPELAALRAYAKWLAAIGGAVLAGGLAGGWWLASRAIRPVDAITATARRIAQGDLSERIPVHENKSELGRLAAVLNETFAQLEESFARQARFTADAAHELRTPVAVILSQAQAALTRERDPAAYQRTLEACVRAARRLHTISEALLDLAAFDAQTSPLQKEPCDLASVARDSAEMLAPLAEARGMPLTLDLHPSPCRADPDRVGQIVTNLLANALQFNRPDRPIRIASGAENGHSFIRVQDEGEGIAPGDLPHVFERFYRADSSRNRQSGGAGLGLAISQDIARAHGGRLEVESTPGTGSTFTLRLPGGEATH